MRRGAIAACVVGLLALAGWGLSGSGGDGVMPSYLAAWLFWVGVPLGALPLVLALEASGRADAGTPVLRRVLLLLPLGSLFALPVLMRAGALFVRTGMAAAWTTPGLVAARALAILLVLCAFALVFSRPPVAGPRRRLAIFGLVLHVCLLSVAAVDWVLALQPGLASSAIGPLVISAQLGAALCLSAFVGAVTHRAPRGAGTLVLVALAAWLFLHFVQYLVVWSANMPGEIAWYLARGGAMGTAAAWFAVAAGGIAMLILATPLARRPATLASLCAMLFVLHALEAFWLVTPAFRHAFSITLADALALLGIGGVTVALLLALLPPPGPTVRHAG